MMRIALFHPWLKAKGGAEKVVLEFCQRSSHDVTVFTLFYDAEASFSGFEEVDVRTIGRNTAPSGLLDKGVRFGIGTALRKLPLDQYDALVVSEAGLGSLTTLRNHRLPIVCYCHTPLRAALPGFNELYREEQHPVLRPVFDIGIGLYNLLERHAWTYFDGVLANSGLTRDRIVSKRLTGAAEVTVVHPGVDVDAFDQGEFGDYFLYPSRFRRYKRQDLAINAFQDADIDDFKLVLAGDAQEPDYVAELQELAGPNVEIRTDVPDDEWHELYANAYSVLFLAAQEDWGIIPLEAMAAGKPVITVNEGGFTEVVQDGKHGRLVDASPAAVADAMRELAADPENAERMGSNGRQTVQNYTWARFAREVDDHVERTVERVAGRTEH